MAWGTDWPYGPLKASLNEPNRQQMHKNVISYIIDWNLHLKWVSKPSTPMVGGLKGKPATLPEPVKMFQNLKNK